VCAHTRVLSPTQATQVEGARGEVVGARRRPLPTLQYKNTAPPSAPFNRELELCRTRYALPTFSFVVLKSCMLRPLTGSGAKFKAY
jgi:hypothetical protein